MTSESDILRLWKFQDYAFNLGQFPLLMGIVNVTPDSFSDGGQYFSTQKAVEHALRLVDEGADILDIGGESTRPQSEPVSEQDELIRVIPVIQQLSEQTSVPISIDTTKAEVARQAIAAGAAIVNDISGLQFDAAMTSVCAEANAGVVCMHILGTPQIMQDNPHYVNVIDDICGFFEYRLNVLKEEGISEEQVVLDPGIGFGKTPQHNLDILSSIHRFRSLGRPVLIGHSRKRFLKAILNRPVDERSSGTHGVSIALAAQHIDILRVHEVAQTRDTLLAWKAVISQQD